QRFRITAGPNLIPASFRPLDYDVPIGIERWICCPIYLQLAIELGHFDEFRRVVDIAPIGTILVGKVVLESLLRYARLQGTLYRISGQIICATVLSSFEERLGFSNSCPGKSLQVDP